MPLILAGWAYSNDEAKHERWLATIEWANRGGFASLIPELGPGERLEVPEFSTYGIGPDGGPMHLPWSFDSKPVPSRELLENALLRLHEMWALVAGENLSECTRPLCFSGPKGRRLVVAVTEDRQPSWGSWERLAPGPERRAFTALRARINRTIRPHMVDHVDFQLMTAPPSSASPGHD
jgi:hypothetical protein